LSSTYFRPSGGREAFEDARFHGVAAISSDALLLRASAFVTASRNTQPTADHESDSLNKKARRRDRQQPVKARVSSNALSRHWDEYVEDKPSTSSSCLRERQAGEPRNVTPGDRDAYPTSTTFSIGERLQPISPDGSSSISLRFPKRIGGGAPDYDVCRVSTHPATPLSEGARGDVKWGRRSRRITRRPMVRRQFSPDGKWVRLSRSEASGLRGRPAGD